MASFEPDDRTTRWFRRRPAETLPQPQAEPARRPRFDRPPPGGNDWYGAPPGVAVPPPVEERPRYPWSPAAPREPFPPGPPQYPAPPERGRLRRRDRIGRRPRRRLLGRVVRVLAAVAVVQALVVLSLRWVDPPTTAFMAANPDGAIQESVPVEHVSRNFLAAVIAHEDAALPYRSGAFDWNVLWGRAYAHLIGEEDAVQLFVGAYGHSP